MLLSLLVQCSGLLEALLIDIILLVIDTTVTIVNLTAILLLDHTLALKLLLPHLVKPILFIVSVRDDPCNQLGINFTHIDRIAIFVNHHARIVDIILINTIIIGIILAITLAPTAKLLLLVDFLSSGDGVFEVDGDLMLSSIIVSI